MAAFNKFNAFVADIGLKVHNLNTDSMMIMLTNTAPVATNAVKTDITEITAGNGYTAGGAAMTGVAYAQTAGVAKLAGSNVTFTASGGSIGPFRYAVLYNGTATAKNLIGWWDNGSAMTLTTGNTFSILPTDTTDILQIS